MQFERIVDLDLAQGRAATLDLGPMLYQDDINSVRIGVRLRNGSEPVEVEGTVVGRALLSNGETIAIDSGEKDGSEAWVVIPQAALEVPGRVEYFMRIYDTETTAVALYAYGYVRRTTTGTIIVPGDPLPDVEQLREIAADCVAATEDALAAVDHAVRYDTAQTLDAAEQAQARGNISALGPSDVDRITGLTDYGPVDGELDTGTGFTGTITRVGNVITLNGTAEGAGSASYWWLRLSGSLSRFTSAPLVPSVRNGNITAMDAAHRYRMRLRLVSGSATLDGEPALVRLGMYKGQPTGAAGSNAPSASEADTYVEGDISERDTANLQAGYSHAMFMVVSKGTVFSNAVYVAELEDMTASAGPGGQLARAADMIAPRETLTAMGNHSEGDLIALGGLLYKATQAIAAGETITPGTNVSATTVAAQLAALAARIAALEG